jgi:hypothetical protein
MGFRRGEQRDFIIRPESTKVESTIRYLGIEVDDTLAIAEQIDV